MPNGSNAIGRLDFPSNNSNEHSRLIHDSERIDSPDEEPESSRSGYFFENVANGIQNRDRALFKRELVRYTSFVWAILSW